MEKCLKEVLTNHGENYILPFYWQHGEELSLLEEGMEKIYQSGIRAVCVEARPHPDFLGEKWWQDMDLIMRKAKELGMKVWLLDDAHFPSGYCNGTIDETSPYRKIFIAHYNIDAVGPLKHASFFIDLEEGEEFVGAVASRRDRTRPNYLTEMQDITDCKKGDVLEWDVPEGFWNVTILKVTSKSGGRKGYANLIDREAVRHFLDTVYVPHYNRYKDEFGKTFVGFFSDEPELGNTHKDIPNPGQSYAGVPTIPLPWCKELEEKLKALWGENYVTNLAVLWNDVDKDSEKENVTGKIRAEYTDLVTRLYQKNFGEQIAEWCHAHGVEYIGHIIEGARFGVGVGHYFRGLWGQDMAGIDIVLQAMLPELDDTMYYRLNGLAMSDGSFFHYSLAKLAASLSHVDEKKKGRAMCEVFGAYGWAEGVKLMKWMTDHMLVRGINHYVPHAFTMKDFPDPDCPPHFYARGRNPQYPYFGLLMEYMNRMSHLIQGGVHESGVGVVYEADLEWINGNLMSTTPIAQTLTRNQIDFDFLPIDHLLTCETKDGRLLSGAPVYEDGVCIGRETMGVLVIPECKCVTKEFASWCENAMEQGLRVLCIDRIPRVMEEDGTLLLWKADHLELVKLGQLSKQLRTMEMGLKVDKTMPYLRYYHYRHKDGAYYLLSNESVHDAMNITITLDEGEDALVTEYDAWNNHIKKITDGKENGSISLHLMPYEMKVLYIGALDETIEVYEEKEEREKQELHIPWNVSLMASGQEKFTEDGVWEKLSNVTGSEKYPRFSGTMHYRAEVELTENDWVGIDLGDVYETARVWVNGEDIGARITPPYRFELNGTMCVGKNTIEVEVTNTLAHQERDFYSLRVPVEPSGMLGPVFLWK